MPCGVTSNCNKFNGMTSLVELKKTEGKSLKTYLITITFAVAPLAHNVLMFVSAECHNFLPERDIAYPQMENGTSC